MNRAWVVAVIVATAMAGALVAQEKKQGAKKQPAKKAAEAPRPPHVTTVTPKEEPGVEWKIVQLCLDANEGCAIADIDGDGRPDITAGRNWYHNPDWVARPLRAVPDWNGYIESNGEHAYDVDGDGNMDVVSGSYLPTAVNWYQNPGAQALALGQMWTPHLLVDTGATKNEATFLRDLDGDGVPEWIVDSWDLKAPLLAWKFAKDSAGAVTMTKCTIGPEHNGHGIAFGDINNDGLEDILVGSGWYERPLGDALAVEWKFHAWPGTPDIHAACPMLIRDLDGDGNNDLIMGKGHDYGLYWWHSEGTQDDGSVKFTEHLIDDSYSQLHALVWADVDGDGQDDLVTGKRKFAHNGRDPGGMEEPCIYYYTLKVGGPDKVEFTRHTIERGHVGIGLQIRTADLNADGKIDIVVAGKSGTYVLLNQGKEGPK